ncbi:MAG TPA: carboxymuconolactone decarboxylase family protein [Dehalococcoidia bacterium]
MARVTEIRDKSQLAAEAHPVFDGIVASRGGIVGPFPVLLHSPEAAAGVSALGHYLRFGTGLSDVERELAILTAARENNAAVEWAGHVRLGKQAGVREEAIDLIGRNGPLSELLPDEALIVDYGRQILRTKRVSKETFDAARKRFGDKVLVDLTALLGYYAMIAATLNAFEVMPPEGAARLP